MPCLQESNNRLKLALQATHTAIWEWSFANSRLVWSENLEPLFGLPAETLFSNYEAILERVHPDDQQSLSKLFSAAGIVGEDFYLEFRIIWPDGSVRWIAGKGEVFQDEDGKPVQMMGMCVDITQTKQATESSKVEAVPADKTECLMNTESVFRATFEQAGVGIAHLTLDGRFMRVNPCFCDLLKYTMEELQCLRVQDITHPEDLEADLINISQLFQQQIFSYSIEKRYRHQEGFYIWANLTVSLVRDASGSPQYFISILEDISERKQAEEALHQREIEMQSLVSLLAEAQKVAHVGWWEFEVATQAVNWSEELFRIVGLDPNQPAPNFTEYLRMVHPDDVKVVTKAVKQVVNEGQCYEFDQRIVRPDGEIRYLAAKGQPIFDNDGNVIKLFGTVLDITERKLAEETLRESEGQLVRKAAELEHTLKALQLTQAQLIQTEKMSSLGQLVAGIAHEINNPINFIFGNLSFAIQYSQDLLGLIHLYQQSYQMREQKEKKDAIQEYIEAIDLDYLKEDLPRLLRSMQIGSERIRSIVLSLRNFSRLDESQMKLVDIHEGIESTLLILQHRLKEKSGRYVIKLIKEFGDLPHIQCYPAQLNQVFMNLLSNAIDALESFVRYPLPAEQKAENLPTEKIQKIIHVRTEYNSNLSRFNLQCVQGSGFKIRNYVVIRIADNGPGISPRIQHKIFDPFFTTKPVGKGTGLGLSICYQIIEKHQGQIWVKSQPAEGTEFVLVLPVQQELVS